MKQPHVEKLSVSGGGSRPTGPSKPVRAPAVTPCCSLWCFLFSILMSFYCVRACVCVWGSASWLRSSWVITSIIISLPQHLLLLPQQQLNKSQASFSQPLHHSQNATLFPMQHTTHSLISNNKKKTCLRGMNLFTPGASVFLATFLQLWLAVNWTASIHQLRIYVTTAWLPSVSSEVSRTETKPSSST